MAAGPDVVCLADFEESARRHLPKYALDYYISGANEEETLRENANAFKRLRIHPRVLRGISQVDMSTTVLGRTISMPICVAPVAVQKMAHPLAETATAKAAQAAKTLMATSCLASSQIEDIASASSDRLLWFQLYFFQNLELNKSLLKRAEECGYKAVVLTVDAQVGGQRLNDVRNAARLLPYFRFANIESDSEKRNPATVAAKVKSLFKAGIDWSTVEWLKNVTKLPIIIKGILTAEDARKAVLCGVAGIVVSNHGGRQLDTVPATIEVLPEIVEAVQGRAEVYLDSGVRLGTDVFKALALGAQAVFIGRPVLWGLAHQGERGVTKVLELLREEFRVTMTLAGCGSIADIKSSMVSKAPYYSHL